MKPRDDVTQLAQIARLRRGQRERCAIEAAMRQRESERASAQALASRDSAAAVTYAWAQALSCGPVDPQRMSAWASIAAQGSTMAQRHAQIEDQARETARLTLDMFTSAHAVAENARHMAERAARDIRRHRESRREDMAMELRLARRIKP